MLNKYSDENFSVNPELQRKRIRHDGVASCGSCPPQFKEHCGPYKESKDNLTPIECRITGYSEFSGIGGPEEKRLCPDYEPVITVFKEDCPLDRWLEKTGFSKLAEEQTHGN